MNTSHSSPNSEQASASADPHWPAPVSVERLVDAGLLVLVRLRDRAVRLVRAGRRDALVLEVDVRGGVERLLEPAGAVERRGAVDPVGVAHLVGDLDLRLRRHLLLDQAHREDRREVVGPAGCIVPGLSGGSGSPGRSGSRFTQWVGISDSGSRYLTVSSLMRPLPVAVLARLGDGPQVHEAAPEGRVPSVDVNWRSPRPREREEACRVLRHARCGRPGPRPAAVRCPRSTTA